VAVAIVMTDFAGGVGREMYDAVAGVLNVRDEPPEGLIFHWAGEVEGKWTISEVWESRAACDSFRSERLFPTIRQVASLDPASGPQPTVREYPVHSYARP
jgi:hypothetical protein